MATIVQINFDFDISEEELEERYSEQVVGMFRDVKGLQWKLWIRNPDNRETGGLYLFEDRASAEAYVNGPIVESVKKMPDSSGHTIKVFEVNEGQSVVTGGPFNHSMHD